MDEESDREGNTKEENEEGKYTIKFRPRLYQERIFYNSRNKNTLIVLPTGLGKTNIFLMLSIYRLNLYPGKKIVFLGPTKPLIEQYKKSFLENTNIEEEAIATFTGEIAPEKREEEWKKSKVVLSTPQSFENDVLGRRISLKDVCLMGFDEAHRAVGNYSYVWIAKQYQEEADFPRIVALTASPGSTLEKIKEIAQNLFIEAIESRSYDDEDVKPYIKETKTIFVEVKLPEEFIAARDYLYKCMKKRIISLKAIGYAKDINPSALSKTRLLEMQSDIRKEISDGRAEHEAYRAISLLAEIMKIQHAIELVETQDIYSLEEYFGRLQEQAQKGQSKAVKSLLTDPDFKSANYLIVLESEKKRSHPKMDKLREILKKEFFDENKKLDSYINKNDEKNDKGEKKAIIFTQYRDSAVKIKEVVSKINGLRPVIFVGQTKKANTGISQKEQKEIIEKFSRNEYNVLISTSVGEEGLDIPKVDFVVFYEPVPSAIRQIQRRGRTGRSDAGKVYVLTTKNTRDEGYRWSAFHKEKRMQRIIEELKKEWNFLKKQQDSGNNTNQNYKETNYIEKKNAVEKASIIADFREKGSFVLKQLYNNPDIDLRLESLKLGDFVVSDRVAIEFKTKEDFINSIIDGRVLEQAKELKENYMKPIILIQGENIFNGNRIDKRAVFGAMSALMIGFGVQIAFTSNYEESALFIASLAKREQIERKGGFNAHGSRKKSLLSEAQRYLVSAIPGINSGLAEPLLSHFSTIKNIAEASVDELQEVEGIGKKKATQIYELFNARFELN